MLYLYCQSLVQEASEVLHLEHSFIWCWNLDASNSRSESPGKFWNVVLEKDPEVQLGRSCEEEVLLRVKEQRNILHEINKRKANWIGHILRRNCPLQRVIEGKIKGRIEMTGRWGRRRRKLLDDLKERRGYSHLKEEALDRTMWRARFGRGFGPVVRQTTKWINEMLRSLSLGHYFTDSSTGLILTAVSINPENNSANIM